MATTSALAPPILLLFTVAGTVVGGRLNEFKVPPAISQEAAFVRSRVVLRNPSPRWHVPRSHRLAFSPLRLPPPVAQAPRGAHPGRELPLPAPAQLPRRGGPPRVLGLAECQRPVLPHPLPQPAHPPVLRVVLGPRRPVCLGGSDQDRARWSGSACLPFVQPSLIFGSHSLICCIAHVLRCRWATTST